MTEQELKIKLDEWFTKNWNHFCNEVRTNIAWGKMEEYSNDLCIECYESFLNKPHEAKLQMYQDSKILNYLLYAASFQIRSGTSPFYNKYRKSRSNTAPAYYIDYESGGYELDDVGLDDMYKCVFDALENKEIDWYHCKLLELKYLKGWTKNEIVAYYDFSMASLNKHMNEALEAVREHCKHLDE